MAYKDTIFIEHFEMEDYFTENIVARAFYEINKPGYDYTIIIEEMYSGFDDTTAYYAVYKID